MSESEIPARGHMAPEQPDPVMPGRGGDAPTRTSAGAAAGSEGLGSAATDAERAGTPAGLPTHDDREAGQEAGTTQSSQGASGDEPDNWVTRDSMDSFPASDPPAY